MLNWKTSTLLNWHAVHAWVDVHSIGARERTELTSHRLLMWKYWVVVHSTAKARCHHGHAGMEPIDTHGLHSRKRTRLESGRRTFQSCVNRRCRLRMMEKGLLSLNFPWT